MKTILTIIVLVLLVLFAYKVFNVPDDRSSDLRSDEVAEHTYESRVYGFTFMYPSESDVREYTAQAISVGRAMSDDAFSAEAEVQVVERTEDETAASYDDFLMASVRNMCAADGPGEAIYCEDKESSEPFENDQGATGERFYVTRVHESLPSGERTTERFGPFYAFPLSETEATSTWTVLLVRPPSSDAVDDVEDDLIRDIAASVRLGR